MMEWDEMNCIIELVARTIHGAEPKARPWDDEPATCQDRFREYARNAITLLDEDIGVLVLALEQAKAEQHAGGPRTSA